VEENGWLWWLMLNFNGHSIHTFDEKGRFIIPSRFRDVIRSSGDETIMLTRMEKVILGYTMNEWRDLEERILEKARNGSKKMRHLRRYIVGAASNCKIDKQGRVVIPPTLRDHAELEKEKEIVLVGLIDHFEIWSRHNWDKNTEQIEDDIKNEELEDEIAEIGLL
jgi:MraZ protein